MTAMKEALKKAGVITIEEKLQNIAIKAMVDHASSMEDTIDAIWKIISKDLTLMIGMFEIEKHSSIRALLYRARNTISTKERKGTINSSTERRAIILVNNIKASDERIRQEELASQKAEQQKADLEYATYQEAWKNSYIGDCIISGVPVWQVTPKTAKLWAERQHLRWNIVEALCEGLPDDGKPIEYYRKPNEVADIFRKITRKIT